MSEREKMSGNCDILRLLALDEQDLDVISANLQNALVRREDLLYLPTERRFVLGLHRLDWSHENEDACQRRLTAMHFEHVRSVHHRNLGETPDTQHTLLAVYFIENETPSGTIVIEFAGGAAIRLDVECLEAQMKDLSPVGTAVETQSADAQVEKGDADNS